MKNIELNYAQASVNYYPAFGYKIFGAETSLDTSGLGGLIDRTFQIKLLKGKPDFYIKELDRPILELEYQELLSRIVYFRKVMLIYRLLHANDLFKKVKTNIDTRPSELAGPIIDLFYVLSENKKALNEILPVLSLFLREKGEISKDSLDYIIFNVVSELAGDKEYYSDNDEKHFKVPHKTLYDKVREASDGINNASEDAFTSPLFEGEITQKKISSYCRDKLKAKPAWVKEEKKSKRVLSFSKWTIQSLKATYDVVTEIQLLDKNGNSRSTQQRKNDDYNVKGEVLTKNEELNAVVELNNLQESVQDIEETNKAVSYNQFTHFGKYIWVLIRKH